MVLIEGGWTFGDRLSANVLLYKQATGVTLASILLMQIGNLLGRRFEFKSGLDWGIFKNKFMISGIIIQIVFSWAILYFPPIQKIINTAPVDFKYYFLAWMGIPLIYGLDYLKKVLTIRFRT